MHGEINEDHDKYSSGTRTGSIQIKKYLDGKDENLNKSAMGERI